MRTAFVVLLLSSCLCFTLNAQVDVRIGFRGGLNLSTWGGDDAVATSDVGVSIDGPESTTGISLGTYAIIGNPDGLFAFQPEILYTQKGTKVRGSVNLFGEAFNFVSTVRFDYIELPLLARLNLAPSSQATTRAYVVAGPAVSFRLNASATGEVNGTTSPTTIDDSMVNKTDLGAVFGAGLDVQFPFATLVIDLRYNLGLTTMDTDGNADIKNRVFSVCIGIVQPW